MSPVDIIILIPLLWGLYKGFVKGAIIELASIVALIGGVYVAVRFCDYMSDKLKNTTNLNQEYIPLLAFSILFIVTVAAVYLVAKLAERFAKAVALGAVNKIAGAGLGAFKFAFALSFIVFILNAIDANGTFFTKDTKQKSVLLEPISQIAPFVIPRIQQSEFAQKVWTAAEKTDSTVVNSQQNKSQIN